MERQPKESSPKIRTHEPDKCSGSFCVIHNPSDHHMRDWPKNFRFDRYLVLVERICPHGVGHPDPDSLAYIESTLPEGRRGYEGIHGCDGCCHLPDPDAEAEREFLRPIR